MDKRFAYIVLGLLVILYLVGRKANPEILQDLQTKAVALAHGKSIWSLSTNTDPGSDSWDKHRQEVLASRVAESKRCALAKYPALAVADSEMNIRFVYRYHLMVKDNDPRLKVTNWPELLADDCAAASTAHAQPKTPAAKSHSVAHADNAPNTSVVVR